MASVPKKTEVKPLSPAEKIEALREVANVIEGEVEHLEELLKFEPGGKKGRYESSGGDPLPTELAQRFTEKLGRIKNGYSLLIDAIGKMTAAQTASGSAEREPT